MTKYRLKGTRVKASAIGTPESFSVTVSRHYDYKAKQAMETARRSMYEDGYDHILFTSCEVRVNNSWKMIPMMQALELE